MHLQARAFAQGLELSGSDRSLQQGFWDALSLMSQTKVVGEVHQPMDSVQEASEPLGDTMVFPAAAAGLPDAVLQ